MSSASETEKTPLLQSRDGRVVTLTINDAPMNPMSLDFMDVLEAVVKDIAADQTVGAVGDRK